MNLHLYTHVPQSLMYFSPVLRLLTENVKTAYQLRCCKINDKVYCAINNDTKLTHETDSTVLIF
jgi:hypothetical protein